LEVQAVRRLVSKWSC